MLLELAASPAFEKTSSNFAPAGSLDNLDNLVAALPTVATPLTAHFPPPTYAATSLSVSSGLLIYVPAALPYASSCIACDLTLSCIALSCSCAVLYALSVAESIPLDRRVANLSAASLAAVIRPCTVSSSVEFPVAAVTALASYSVGRIPRLAPKFAASSKPGTICATPPAKRAPKSAISLYQGASPDIVPFLASWLMMLFVSTSVLSEVSPDCLAYW